MADEQIIYAELLRLYDKACLEWAQPDSSKILRWTFDREGEKGKYTVEREEIIKFIDRLVRDEGLEPLGNAENPDYWLKAKVIIDGELQKATGQQKIKAKEMATEFQTSQPDEVTLKNLETIAADQAKRRNIPIQNAREMVWKILKLQAKSVVNETAGSQAENLPESLLIKQPIEQTTQVGEATKTISPNQKYFDQEMDHIVQRADNRNYSLRREPDKLLFENIKFLFSQIFKNTGETQAVDQVVYLADEQSPQPDYSRKLDSPEQSQSFRQAVGVGKRLAGEVTQRLTKKGLQSAAQKLGWTALETGVKAATTAGTTVVKGAVLKGAGSLAAAIFGGPVGWVIGAATLLKGVFDFLVKGGIGKFFKKIFSRGVSQGQIYAKKGLDAAGLSGMFGGLLGAIIGIGGGPVGMMGLGLVGAFIGKSAGSFLGAFLGGNITLGPGGGGGETGDSKKSKDKKGLMVLLGGAGIISAGVWAVIILVVLIILFFLNQNKQQDQGTPVAFKVSITANPTKLPDWNDNSHDTIKYSIKYSIQITANSNLDLKKVKINVKLSDRTGSQFQLLSPLDLTISKTELTAGESVSLPFDFDIPGRYGAGIFIDSKVFGQAEVTGQVQNEPEETWSATALTTIGNPPFNQPYGFPATGSITQLDIYPGICRITATDGKVTLVGAQLNSDGGYYCVKPDGAKSVVYVGHSGTPLTSNLAIGYHNPIPGGMDIGQAGGNVPVYSTIDGTVIKSVFDLGPTIVRGTEDSCYPNKILAQALTAGQTQYRFCKGALGGAVYIQSDDQKYVAAYLHLSEDELIAQGTRVTRGQQIGKTFPGRICETTKGLPEMCTSQGPHVHYQIFLDNFTTSLNFNDVNITGSCLEGKILPAGSDPDKPQPAIDQKITQAVTECK